jgi:hypothetical protein
MDLDRIVPDSSDSWKVSKGQLLFKKYVWLPICCEFDGHIVVFLDRRMHKAVIKVVKRLMSLGLEFSCMSPEFSSPKGVSDWQTHNIEHCLKSYASEEFFHGFERIGFDLIKNMTDWAEREGCFDEVKECYLNVKKEVCRHYYDYYSKKDIYEYSPEIRDSFERIYREIQINRIL